MKRRNIFLPDELVAAVKEVADKRGQTMAHVIRTAIERYLAAIKRAEEAKSNG